MEARLASQHAKYKAGITNAPERRFAHAVQLRKEHRAALLQSKRRRPEEADAGLAITATELAAALREISTRPSPARVAAYTLIRKALSLVGEDELQARIQRCLDAGLVRCCATALAESPSMEERLECAWIFTCVSTGSHAQTMAVLPVVPLLAACTAGDSFALAEHCAWAIGNLAADSIESRTALHRLDVVAPLLSCMRSRDRRLAKTSAWACSNIIRGAKGPVVCAAEIGDVALRMLSSMPLQSPASASHAGSAVDALGLELATEMAWVLSMVTSGDEDVCSPLVAAGAFPAAVRCLGCGHTPLATPCLRVLGNLLGLQLAYLDEAISQPALLPALCAIITPQPPSVTADAADGSPDDAGMLDAAGDDSGARSSPTPQFFRIGHVKEALWVVSNLLGGSPKHAAAVLASPAWSWPAGVPPDARLPLPLMHILAAHMTSSPWPVRIEAAMCFANLCMQRAAVTAGPHAGAVSVAALALPRPSPHPFLAAVLYFPGVLREFLAMLQAVDIATVRMALSVVDVVLHAWRPPPAAEVALRERIPELTLEPLFVELLSAVGPAESGVALVESAGGIDALEQLEYRFVESEQHPHAGGGASGSGSVSEWAHRLVDEFFGADAELEDSGPGVSATHFGFGISSSHADVAASLGASSVYGDFSAVTLPSGAPVAAAGRGAASVLPAWMKK